MPPPTTTASRPGRYLAALAVLIVVMLASVIGASFVHPGSWHSRFRVGLGLDLSSGTTITLRAVPLKKGAPVPQSAMNQAITILLARVNGSGLNGATVQQQGTDIINVSVPGRTSSQVVDLIGSTAKLRFRQVLVCTGQLPGATSCGPPLSVTPPSGSPSGSPSPSASGSPSPSHGTATPGRSPSASRSGSPSGKPSAKTKAAVRGASNPRATVAADRARPVSPSPAANASPKPSSSPSASRGSPRPSSSGSPTPSGSPSPTPSATLPAGGSVIGDPTLANPAVLKLFNKLSCQGSATQRVRAVQKGVYHGDPNLWEDPNSQIVACGLDGAKYLLDKAVVTGDELTSASAGQDITSQWVVDLSLNGKGTRAFAALTSQLASKYCPQGCTTSPSPLDEFAIVLGGQVEEAPFIQQAINNGQARISGNFNQSSANQLANILKYGELQLDFVEQSVTTVSPQLGSSQLQAGLLAGLVGLLLVVIYSFFYYRGLGIVSVSSLAIAALLTWLTVILLTAHAGFTLSLAGVAGMIVAIGITADSFVVFFERLRDEVREGRSLRAAVERGWTRARRTILVSDTVSFLAAALLYYFAIGDVKGFAFTLGLTTLIDIVVVFLFTKPMVTLLARTKFFGGGHKLSGLDAARLGTRSPWRGSRVPARPATGGAATAAPAKPAPREA